MLKRLDGKDRRCLFNSTVIKAMTYGSEVWSPTKAEENLLAVTERAMERRMLKVFLCDHIKNDTLRQMSGVKDVVVATRENKLRWAGHVARLRDDRWSSIIKNWLPRERKRPVGRPPLRWREYMVKVVGQNWQGIAQDRVVWKSCARRVSTTH